MVSNQISTTEPSPLIKLPEWVLRLFIIAPFLFLLVLVSVWGRDIPFWDQWDFIPFLEQAIGQKELTFKLFWTQHGEHRIFFPKIIMYGLVRLTHWDIRYELFTNLILGCLIFLVLRRAAHRLFSDSSAIASSRETLFLDAALSIFVFSITQCENWFWGWQIQIFLAILAISLGFYFLTTLRQAPFLRLVGAIGCGVVATGSFGNGILYWPIGFVILWFISGPRPWLYRLIWLFCSGLFVSFYFRDYQFIEGRAPVSYMIDHPIEGVFYLLAYLGSPIAQFQEIVMLACWVGFVAIGLLLFLIVRLYQTKLLFRPELLFWHALLLYALASDVLTALGRVEFGRAQAMASRYVTISNLFWIWVIVVGYYLIIHQRLRFSGVVKWLTVGLLVLFTASTVKDTYESIRRGRHLAHVEAEFKKPRPDRVLTSSVYPKPERFDAYCAFLKQHQLSLFNDTH